MKNKAIIFLILIIAVLLIWDCSKMKSLENEILRQKKEIIKRDSLMKITDGKYSKLVNDLKTQKELNKLTGVKKSVSQTKVIFKPKYIQTKPKVIYLNDCKELKVNDYYPNEKDYFINYSISGGVGKWKFTTLPIEIVINEELPNIYKATLTGAKWLDIKSIEINSLPIKPPKINNFDWLAGVGINTNVPYVFGGARYKSIFASAGVGTNAGLNFSIGKLF